MVVQLQSWFLLFNGCGKNNYLQRYFQKQINRWDATTNLQLVEKRQEVLRECKREKRSYLKNLFILVLWRKGRGSKEGRQDLNHFYSGKELYLNNI